MSAWRHRSLLLGWLACGVLVLGRAATVQVLEGAEWRDAATAQQRASEVIPAPRGAILDREGVPLAVSRETFRVSIAPKELTDVAATRVLLEEVLGISSRSAQRATDQSKDWRVIPGTHPPAVRERLRSVQGVYLERVLRRFYPHGDLARAMLGRVLDDEGRGGIEEGYDDLLRGAPGRRVFATDIQGRAIPGELFEWEPPSAGGDLRLTIDLDLQEIAYEALSEAVAETEARGGDMLVTDPHSGEILAMVSLRDGSSNALSSINTPYEPGSTLKPFTIAALLARDAVELSDSVDTQGGEWRVGGRTLHDEKDYGTLTVADALRVSSNVGVAMVAQALTPAEQYQNLRDFGFGVPTGVPLPGEVGGTLRRPEDWTGPSPSALAIGYEISTTPLQMAMAYGSIANGGVLMEPLLVREIRSADGRVLERGEPREIRRVVPKRIMDDLARVLVDVVEDGTGTAARLTSFQVAGKSGTTRAYVPGSGYEAGRYLPSFVGFFPADDPQLVIFVKLDDPQGANYYGGATAAPVTRATMEAVLAAGRPAIDRRALLEVARASQPPAGIPAARFAASGDAPPTPAAFRDPIPERARPDPSGAVVIPDVVGLPARVAARRLHAFGLRVIWEGDGSVRSTVPPAGARWMVGDTIRLRSGRNEP